MQFDALIVDPNPFSRANLWQATLYDPNFKSVKAVSRTEDAIAQLSNGNKFDVLLITSEISNEEIQAFIPQARQIGAGKEAAYVIVLKTKDQEAEKVASRIVDGTDGFLLEPYSVHSLKQVAAIAARVKGEHEKQRARAAVTLLLKELMPKLDEYAELRRKKNEATHASKEFRRVASGLKKIIKNQQEVYVTTATELFEAAPPRAKPKYKGASKRVKQLIEES